jgi:metal-sulfur cluster biosynthetic enzyme
MLEGIDEIMTPLEKLKLLKEKLDSKGKPINKENIINNLKQVYDPEMSEISVYELGLIYNIDTDEKEGIVELTHTLTSAFCPFADEIIHAIHKACEVENVNSVNIITTFDPPFTMEMVPEETRLMLGW